MVIRKKSTQCYFFRIDREVPVQFWILIKPRQCPVCPNQNENSHSCGVARRKQQTRLHICPKHFSWSLNSENGKVRKCPTIPTSNSQEWLELCGKKCKCNQLHELLTLTYFGKKAKSFCRLPWNQVTMEDKRKKTLTGQKPCCSFDILFWNNRWKNKKKKWKEKQWTSFAAAKLGMALVILIDMPAFLPWNN